MCACVSWPALFLRISCVMISRLTSQQDKSSYICGRACKFVCPDLFCSSELGMWWPARWHLQPQICVCECRDGKSSYFLSVTLTFSLQPPFSASSPCHSPIIPFHLFTLFFLSATQVVKYHSITVKRAPHVFTPRTHARFSSSCLHTWLRLF